MRRLLRALSSLVVLSALASAQTPIFTPVPKPEEGKPVPAQPGSPKARPPGGKDAKPGAANDAAPTDPVASLMARLSEWPSPRAKDAALVLAGLGSEVEPALIKGLSHND